MGSKYIARINPFSDFMLESIVSGVDISKKKHFVDVYNACVLILETILTNPNDIKYLDFEIKGNNGYIRLVANNLITALWLSGVFPNDVDLLVNRNVFKTEEYVYRYDKKTKKLIRKINK